MAGWFLAHIEGLAYLRPRKPVTAQLSHSVGVNKGAGSSELLAFCTRIAEPGLDSLLNEESLELCHGPDDLEHQAPGWSTEIEVIAEADKRDAIGAEVSECID
jgi:hypothetical protein